VLSSPKKQSENERARCFFDLKTENETQFYNALKIPKERQLTN
jgi:hypothetical protein